MREFSFTNAWTWGVRFFSGAALGHATLLLGMGIALPLLLQIVLFGRPAAMIDSASPQAADLANSILLPLVTAAGYVLQTCSFFASWRLGAGRSETFGRALIFGLIAGVMVSFGFAIAVVAVGAIFGMISIPVALVAVLVVFVGLFAIAWTTFAALFAASVWLLFLTALTMGAYMGDMTFAATVVGGSGVVWTILVAASLVLLWLAARLSCTTMLMAERKSFNVIAAMRESWSLTWDDEWRITRYLAALGLVMALLLAGAIVLAGAGLAATLQAANQPGGDIGTAIVLLILSVPLAYLAVLVPAGIRRELQPVDTEAVEVFA